MALTLDDIHKVAHLARIEISTQEAQATLNKLSGIMDLIADMQSVDTTHVEPMSHAQDLSQRLREDVITKINERALFQENAPAVAEGLYLVPQVIE